MTHNSLAEQLAVLLSEILNEKVSPIQMNARIAEDYRADSMDMVDIADRLEETFDIEVTTEDIQLIQTFGSTLAMITPRVEARTKSNDC